MTPPTVHVDQLRFGYGRGDVIHGLSFDLHAGEVVGLLGPNGAGKSTTIKILTGILAPGDGTVQAAGFSLPREALEVKRRIGYAPEAAAVFESLSGQEFLELTGRLHDVPEETLQRRIDRLLDRFGLLADRKRRLEGYSKGMRQKVLLAAALLHDPRIVLLDEPLSGLDVSAAITVKEIITELAADGRTILYSSHILDVVERVCNRILILHEGRLIADDSPEALKTRTREATLENVFRQLTRSGEAAEARPRSIVEDLRA